MSGHLVLKKAVWIFSSTFYSWFFLALFLLLNIPAHESAGDVAEMMNLELALQNSKSEFQICKYMLEVETWFCIFHLCNRAQKWPLCPSWKSQILNVTYLKWMTHESYSLFWIINIFKKITTYWRTIHKERMRWN